MRQTVQPWQTLAVQLSDIAELMELVDGQRRWCTQQEAAYRQMNEGILAELRKAQCCVEECDLGNFQQFQESLRQLAETINGGE